MRALQTRTARATPFYYGWIILGLSGVVSYSARPLMSVAVLTVFVVPMSEQFGWTRAQVAGAVSLGGALALVASPLVGPVLDRYGSAMVVGIFVGHRRPLRGGVGSGQPYLAVLPGVRAGAGHGVRHPFGTGHFGGGEQLVHPPPALRAGPKPRLPRVRDWR